jgi:hypothetical protein
MIVSAAIIFEEQLHAGKTHNEIMKNIRKEFPDAHFPSPDKQGFINEKGEFLKREPALMEAIKCNQVVRGKTFNPRELFSEDLLSYKELKR